MKTAETDTYTTIHRPDHRGNGQPFFRTGGDGHFLGSSAPAEPFFSEATPRSGFASDTTGWVQRQPQEGNNPGVSASGTGSAPSTANRTAGCDTSPRFPNFRCLAYRLKLDVDDNLRQNGHHLLRVAALHPYDTQLQFDTFLRYGLGVNLLQTSFGFLGAEGTLGNILSYGTGVGFKGFNYLQTGQLEIDIPIPLGDNTQLEIQFNLDSNPDNLREIRRVDGMIGISGRHDWLGGGR